MKLANVACGSRSEHHEDFPDQQGYDEKLSHAEQHCPLFRSGTETRKTHESCETRSDTRIEEAHLQVSG